MKRILTVTLAGEQDVEIVATRGITCAIEDAWENDMIPESFMLKILSPHTLEWSWEVPDADEAK